MTTWERTQEQLRRRAYRHETTKLTDQIYPLRKKAYCVGCGRRLRGRNQHGQRCYRCPAAAYGEHCSESRDVRATLLESQVGDWLAQWRLPENWQSQVMARIGSGDGQAREAQKRIAKLDAALEQLRKQHKWQLLSDEQLLSESADIKRERDSIHIPPPPNLDRVRQWLRNLPAIWERATDLEKLKLLDALIEKVWIKGGRIVAIEPRVAVYPLWIKRSINLKRVVLQTYDLRN